MLKGKKIIAIALSFIFSVISALVIYADTISTDTTLTEDKTINLDATSATTADDFTALKIESTQNSSTTVDLDGHKLNINVTRDASVVATNKTLVPNAISVPTGSTVTIKDGDVVIVHSGTTVHQAIGVLNQGSLTFENVNLSVTNDGKVYAIYDLNQGVSDYYGGSIVATSNNGKEATDVYAAETSTANMYGSFPNLTIAAATNGTIVQNPTNPRANNNQNNQNNQNNSSNQNSTPNTNIQNTVNQSAQSQAASDTSSAINAVASYVLSDVSEASSAVKTMGATNKSWYISPWVYGGVWGCDDKGYYYKQENGTYLTGQSSGITSPKRIGGAYYAFDDDGYMFTGWVDESSGRCDYPEGWKNATYYFGPDGAMAINCWKKVLVTDYDANPEVREYWFYFDGKGQKVRNTENTNYKDRIIDHEHYAFADDGHMLTGWQFMGDDTDPESDASLWQYFGSEVDMTGNMLRSGWFLAIPPEGLDKSLYDNEEEKWFYAKSGGYVCHGGFETIKNKKYLFDTNGAMVTGLRWVDFDIDTNEYIGCTNDLQEDSITLDAILEAFPDGKGVGKSGLYYFTKNGDAKSGKKTFTIDGKKYKIEPR